MARAGALCVLGRGQSEPRVLQLQTYGHSPNPRVEQGAPGQGGAGQCQPSRPLARTPRTGAMNWSALHMQTASHVQMDTSWLPHFGLEEGNTSNLAILRWPVHSSKHIWPFLYRLTGTKAESSTLFEIQILISAYQHWYHETEVWIHFLPHLPFSLWPSYIEIWYFISNIIWKAELSRIHTSTSLVNLPLERESVLLFFYTKLLLDSLGLFFLKQHLLTLERKDCW